MTASPAAYVAVVLHALKHPSQPVFGVLIGKKTADGNFHVLSAIPLFHTELASFPHPMSSVALKQIAAVCRATGRCIVGAYFANERLNDVSIHDHTHALLNAVSTGEYAETVAAGSASQVVWQLDNSRIHPSTGAVAVRVIGTERRGSDIRLQTQKGSIVFAKWNPDELKASIAVPEARVLEVVAQLVESRKFSTVVDFEDHLDDVNDDYFNSWIESLTA